MKFFDEEFTDLSNDQLDAVDRLCCRYERDRRQGNPTDLEQLVADIDPAFRSPMLCELLRVEVEILAAWDQLRETNLLRRRFPDHSDWIDQAMARLDPGRREAESATAASYSPTRIGGSTTDADLEIRSGTQECIPPDELGTPLPSRFHILRHLAEGGIGELFVAFDRDLQREVALKQLKQRHVSSRSVMERFRREGSITGNLEHPGIVPIYASGIRSDGRPYYAMRLIQGQTLSAAIAELHTVSDGSIVDFRSHPVARDLLLRLIDVCRAIAFAHSRGIIHRDVKPQNIMIGNFGETLVVDWGLARRQMGVDSPAPGVEVLEQTTGRSPPLQSDDVADVAESGETKTGTVVGTYGYMSPEQAAGRIQDVTTASDVFSLGATLYTLLTGQAPANRNIVAGADAVPSAVPSANPDLVGVLTRGEIDDRQHHSLSPRRIAAGIPRALDAICRTATASAPACRYADAARLGADLQAWLTDQPVSVFAESVTQRLRRWARRSPSWTGGMGGGLLMAFAAMAVLIPVLAFKNESLRQANRRETVAAETAAASETLAVRHSAEAVRQRQRVLAILNTFLTDVQRGLNNVPGGAAVQKNVLTTVLNQLADVSQEFGDSDTADQSSVMALMDLGDLFLRVGIQDVQLNSQLWNSRPATPLDAAERMYGEAMSILNRVGDAGGDVRAMTADIFVKQADVLRQRAKSQQALDRLTEALAIRRSLLQESPLSYVAQTNVAAAIDQIGQVHLQNSELVDASLSFAEAHAQYVELNAQSPGDPELRRRLALSFSRLGDIASRDNRLDEASQFYEQDLKITTEQFHQNPDNATARRDLSISSDRLGNTYRLRGRPEQALEYYLVARDLRSELHLAEPDDQRSSRELFVSFMKCGDIRMSMKRTDEARADYLQAQVIADELVARNPENAATQRMLSMTAEVLADIAIASGEFDEALSQAELSLGITQQLADRDPADGQTQRDLMIGFAKVAKVYSVDGRPGDAVNRLLTAAGIAERLLKDVAGSTQAATDYNYILLKLVTARLEHGDGAHALADCQKIIDRHEALPPESALDVELRRRLAAMYVLKARAAQQAEDPASARTSAEHARMLTQQMIDEQIPLEAIRSDLQEINRFLNTLKPSPPNATSDR